MYHQESGILYSNTRQDALQKLVFYRCRHNPSGQEFAKSLWIDDPRELPRLLNHWNEKGSTWSYSITPKTNFEKGEKS